MTNKAKTKYETTLEIARVLQTSLTKGQRLCLAMMMLDTVGCTVYGSFTQVWISNSRDDMFSPIPRTPTEEAFYRYMAEHEENNTSASEIAYSATQASLREPPAADTSTEPEQSNEASPPVVTPRRHSHGSVPAFTLVNETQEVTDAESNPAREQEPSGIELSGNTVEYLNDEPQRETYFSTPPLSPTVYATTPGSTLRDPDYRRLAREYVQQYSTGFATITSRVHQNPNYQTPRMRDDDT